MCSVSCSRAVLFLSLSLPLLHPRLLTIPPAERATAWELLEAEYRQEQRRMEEGVEVGHDDEGEEIEEQDEAERLPLSAGGGSRPLPTFRSRCTASRTGGERAGHVQAGGATRETERTAGYAQEPAGVVEIEAGEVPYPV